MPSTTSTARGTARSAPNPRRTAPPEPEEALDQAAVAELSSVQIRRMTVPELTRVVRAGGLPEVKARPEYLDRGTLERMAHLSRLCCRHRAR